VDSVYFEASSLKRWNIQPGKRREERGKDSSSKGRALYRWKADLRKS
jgi:hypothetical protein